VSALQAATVGDHRRPGVFHEGRNGAMKVQKVILRAMAKKITWWRAAHKDIKISLDAAAINVMRNKRNKVEEDHVEISTPGANW